MNMTVVGLPSAVSFMEATMKCLVTGATGAVGPRLVEVLHKAGWQVRVLVRQRPSLGLLPDRVEHCLGDVADPVAVGAAVTGMDVVFHLAALLHIINSANPPPELRQAYERTNVDGTRNVVEAALAAGVQRVVFFSTIAVYGYNSGRLVDETMLPCPDTFYGQTKQAAEELVLSAQRSDGRPLGVVLRPGAVYGARVKGNYRLLLGLLRRGWFLPIGNGRNRRTLIHDRDLAQAALLVATHPDAAGGVFNVTDGRIHEMRDIIAAMCAALGRQPPRFALPVRPIRMAAGIVENMARISGRSSPISRAAIDKFTEEAAVDGRLLHSRLGFKPQYDLEVGWRETVLEMRLEIRD